MASTSDRLSGSPARLTVRTDAGTAPSRTSSAIAEGTVLSSTTSADRRQLRQLQGVGGEHHLAPQASVTNSSKTDRSNETDVAASTPARSAAGKTVRAQWAKATALRCSIATPFGRPVEPEV